jgi:hypothetical protein
LSKEISLKQEEERQRRERRGGGKEEIRITEFSGLGKLADWLKRMELSKFWKGDKGRGGVLFSPIGNDVIVVVAIGNSEGDVWGEKMEGERGRECSNVCRLFPPVNS